MKEQTLDPIQVVLPAHVYRTFDDYVASSEYRPAEPGGISIDEIMTEIQLYQCNPPPMCREEKHRWLYTWVTKRQAKICMFCSPTKINPRGVLILSWLTEERRAAYIDVLMASLEEERQKAEADERKALLLAQRRTLVPTAAGRQASIIWNN